MTSLNDSDAMIIKQTTNFTWRSTDADKAAAKHV